jgi:hypothetical protein
MDRLNDRIGRGRQEAVDQMGARDGFRLRAAVASVFGPHTGEGKERHQVCDQKGILDRETDTIRRTPAKA